MAFSVDLGEQLETVVNDLISKGRYGSKSEVLREGVRLVQEREARLTALNAALDEGLADIKAGRTLSIDEALDLVDAKLDELLAAAAEKAAAR